MSGRKQHYIPQFMLRGFGDLAGGNKHKVIVYSCSKGVFKASTEGVGAERDFYSEMGTDIETLDDKITKLEFELVNDVLNFRNAKIGEVVDSCAAARLATHLCIRQAYFRNSAVFTMSHLLDMAAEVFLSQEKSREFFGVNDDRPNASLDRELKKIYSNLRPQFQSAGIGYNAFRDSAFAKIKAEFAENFREFSPELANIFNQLKAGAATTARNAHIKALTDSLLPEKRVERLRELNWQLVDSAVEIILPDCIAISISSEGLVLPLIYDDGTQPTTVILPLSSTRYLLGGHNTVSINLERDLIANLAGCSWDFFVSKTRSDVLESQMQFVGERTVSHISSQIGEAFEESSLRWKN